jgi:hypothetical protein
VAQQRSSYRLCRHRTIFFPKFHRELTSFLTKSFLGGGTNGDSARSLAELLQSSILVTVQAIMSTNGMAGTSPHNAFQNAALALSSLPSVDLPHVLVVVFFLFVLRAKTTYLPISVPAFLLAAYREWALLKKDGTSIFKYSLSSILACWFGTFAYRLVKHRIMMHHLVRSLWPHSRA